MFKNLLERTYPQALKFEPISAERMQSVHEVDKTISKFTGTQPPFLTKDHEQRFSKLLNRYRSKTLMRFLFGTTALVLGLGTFALTFMAQLTIDEDAIVASIVQGSAIKSLSVLIVISGLLSLIDSMRIHKAGPRLPEIEGNGFDATAILKRLRENGYRIGLLDGQGPAYILDENLWPTRLSHFFLLGSDTIKLRIKPSTLPTQVCLIVMKKSEPSGIASIQTKPNKKPRRRNCLALDAFATDKSVQDAYIKLNRRLDSLPKKDWVYHHTLTLIAECPQKFEKLRKRTSDRDHDFEAKLNNILDIEAGKERNQTRMNELQKLRWRELDNFILRVGQKNPSPAEADFAVMIRRKIASQPSG